MAICFCAENFAQMKGQKVIQFSGYALTADSLIGVPFAHITIKNRGRVTTAGPDGFFSFAAVEGDTLYFTSVGFKPWVYIIPKDLETDKFSMIQLMSRSENYFTPVYIFPWKRDDFHRIFMETHPPEDALERARKNLERETLAAQGKKLEPDGREAAELSLQQQSATKYYYGQTPPQNIFNPLAWADFIKAWQRGDFKKKNTSSSSNGDNGDNSYNGEDIYNTNGGH
jgi:hypothetical protein